MGFLGDAESRFWEWFTRASNHLIAVQTGYERICDELAYELSKVHSGLKFEFGTIVDGRREFIISADGVAAVFPAVQKLVGAAPNLPGWKIIAFRPPKNRAFAIRFDNFELSQNNIWFLARPAGRKADLTLFIRGLYGHNRDAITRAVFILLDAAIGEYNVVTKIGRIDMKPVGCDPSTPGILPFGELPQVIGSL